MTEIVTQMSTLSITPKDISSPNDPGSNGFPVMVQTNLFPVRVSGDKTRSIYRYDVTIFGTSQDVEDIFEDGVQPIRFTRKTLNDVVAINGRARSGVCLELFVKRYPDIFPSDIVLYYDQVSILFASQALKFNTDWTEQFMLTDEEAQGPLQGFKRVALAIKMCDRVGQTALNHYTQSTNNLEDMAKDRSLLQFMEIVVSQSALKQPERFLVFENGKTYFRKPGKEDLPKYEFADLPDGKQLMVGCTKSAVVIEGPKGRGRTNLGLIVDAKKAAFHKNMNASIKACQTLPGFNFQQECSKMQLEKLNTVFRGVFITPTTSKSSRSYKVVNVAYNAHKVVNIKGENISVGEYFKQKHNITLEAPLAPLLCVQGRQETYFPMEVSIVLPDQRVQVMQQTGEQSRETTKECAVLPQRRQDLIMANVHAQGILDPENKYLKEAGIEIIGPAPIQVPGRQLPKPAIMYRQGVNTLIDDVRCSWRHPQRTPYLIPASVGVWCCYSIGRKPFQALNDLCARMVRECQQKGIKIQNVASTGHCEAANLEELFKYLKDNKCEFLMVIMDDQIMAQDELKLYERKYEILTQNIKQKTARDICEKNKGSTVENLCNKLNIKCGGINFTIGCQNGRFLFDRKTVVIGIGASNPPPATKIDVGGKVSCAVPSVVGFSANICQESESFAGDFVVVHPRDEKAQMIGAMVVRKVFGLWKKGGFCKPERVVIYRAGLGHGSFDTVVSTEVPQIREVFEELKVPNIKLTYIICAKDHGMRLFETRITGQRGPEQNVKSGLVIDHMLTHPKLRQFYLNSHVTLQGTASTPMYTILYDESEYSMDAIQTLTFNLSYNHQIVNLPTSFPAPLYIANRYADRGRRLFVQDTKTDTNSTGLEEDGLHTRANEKLIYGNSRFERVRVNA